MPKCHGKKAGFSVKMKTVELVDSEEVSFLQIQTCPSTSGAAGSTQDPHIKNQWLTL